MSKVSYTLIVFKYTLILGFKLFIIFQLKPTLYNNSLRQQYGSTITIYK